ncbi:SUZ domain protein [Ceratobasidium sp. AG-Ba]|nr:SUZ domain protein [Ceratobasidium sp. AG-Ba]
MTSSVTSSADVPAWDTPPIITTKPTRPVPDDWDADDPEEESAKDIWERANSAAPMPQIQFSSSQQSTILPPVSAIMPSMRILQRPKSSSPGQSNSGPGTPGNGAKTMKEREAEYKAARDRIFANSGGGEGASEGNSREGSPAPKRGILTRGRGGANGGHGGQRRGSPNSADGPRTVREPTGPAQEGRGFAPRGRRGRGGAPKEPVQDQQ